MRRRYVPSMEYAREHYEPMNDRQFAAMMIQVYEEKIATDNTEGRVKDFPRFVVRFMSVHFGTRTLMAARLGGYAVMKACCRSPRVAPFC